MTVYSYNIMNNSTRIGESGARPHRERKDSIPVGSKIFMFVLSIRA